MSESSREGDRDGTEPTENSPEPPDTGLISDEQLPEDLQPGKNPLARDPGDEPDEGEESAGGSGEPKVEGMPDMGQPGAAS
jgi:hypothetical protein